MDSKLTALPPPLFTSGPSSMIAMKAMMQKKWDELDAFALILLHVDDDVTEPPGEQEPASSSTDQVYVAVPRGYDKSRVCQSFEARGRGQVQILGFQASKDAVFPSGLSLANVWPLVGALLQRRFVAFFGYMPCNIMVFESALANFSNVASRCNVFVETLRKVRAVERKLQSAKRIANLQVEAVASASAIAGIVHLEPEAEQHWLRHNMRSHTGETRIFVRVQLLLAVVFSAAAVFITFSLAHPLAPFGHPPSDSYLRESRCFPQLRRAAFFVTFSLGSFAYSRARVIPHCDSHLRESRPFRWPGQWSFGLGGLKAPQKFDKGLPSSQFQGWYILQELPPSMTEEFGANSEAKVPSVTLRCPVLGVLAMPPRSSEVASRKLTPLRLTPPGGFELMASVPRTSRGVLVKDGNQRKFHGTGILSDKVASRKLTPLRLTPPGGFELMASVPRTSRGVLVKDGNQRKEFGYDFSMLEVKASATCVGESIFLGTDQGQVFGTYAIFAELLALALANEMDDSSFTAKRLNLELDAM
ncbi:hypothetical protein AK812_SmicGene34455 [Symbiodinium microadriaticum]|uniref:Uncharacterized protein n=1 Tax=Symbiodinium microadriaticum TaxID=2951 RepID=A0A1Q9CNY9_SYMMI|nr:hypothetical protein AK812_SmicGene34455 [Symbiodinium microadriaticum]